jgi:type VI secretion system secreted protein Hcp
MALGAYMTVTGKKQGKFKGETAMVRREDQISILAFTMELASPRDPATGQATGKRQYQPVTVTKEWGAASPQGLAACSTNEVLTTVRIEFVKTHANGEEYIYQTVTLTDATISDVNRFTGDLLIAEGLPGGSRDPAGLERWSFTFREIQVDDADGKTTFLDDWAVTA